MYQDMYELWLAAELDDADLKPELESVKGDDAAIQDRFAVALKFRHRRSARRHRCRHQPYEYLRCPSGDPGPGQLG